MFNLLHHIEQRILGKMRTVRLRRKLREYKRLMRSDHPMANFPVACRADVSADPKEFFSHYDAYAFWAAKKINGIGGGAKILDVGNRKMANAMNSVSNDVTAIVLADCEDSISNVNYVIHDISRPLPFGDHTFDIFTSLASLNIAGLSRYGDKLDPYTLVNFIGELDRVMKKRSDILVSLCLGRNFLSFNNGWFFDFETLCGLFSKWRLLDFLIDNNSVPNPRPYQERFTRDIDLDSYPEGEYRVIFMHFGRDGTEGARDSM